MSEVSEAIQAKCLAFGDRIIKLNDYLLSQAALEHEKYKKELRQRKFGQKTSSFSLHTSDISQPSDFIHHTSLWVPAGSRLFSLILFNNRQTVLLIHFK